MSLPVKAALLASRDLRGTDRLVVLAIAAHTNTAGDAWPSVSTIAEYVGVSERTVQRALARLVTAGRLVVRQVAGIATRVYRIVVDAVKGVTSTAPGVTDQQQAVPEPAPGGDRQDGAVAPEVEEGLKGKSPARVGGRLDWRRYVPGKRGTNPTPQRPSHTERRGAALPPANRADQCLKHPGCLAHNCGPCRSERMEALRDAARAELAGGAR